MTAEETKGITVKVNAKLHEEVHRYLEAHHMTMGQFVAMALADELHPKIQEQEGNHMSHTRTIAFQVPEDLFQRLKEYLARNQISQRQFLVDLIERELVQELTRCEAPVEAVSADGTEDGTVEESPEGPEAGEPEPEQAEGEEPMGFSMGM